MKKTLIIGSTVVDIIVKVPHLPNRSEDINVHSQHMQVGGCAYNVAQLLCQYNSPFTLFSPVGSGIYGDFIRTCLAQCDMDMPLLHIEEENGVCYCLVEADCERSFLSVHGAEYVFKKEWFTLLDSTLYDSAYICGLEMEEESGIHIIEYLETNPLQDLYFAPGPRIMKIEMDRLQRIFALSPILHLNEQEAMAYTKTTSLKEMASVLYRETHNTVIITLGARGAYVYDNSFNHLIETIRVDVVDTIGAGDAHIASIIASRKEGVSMLASIEIANRMAALVTTCEGSLLSDEKFDNATSIEHNTVSLKSGRKAR